MPSAISRACRGRRRGRAPRLSSLASPTSVARSRPTRMYALFVQDDWQLAPVFKLLYGVRYDTYTPPDGSSGAVLAASRTFPEDRNNWQPRAGFVWTLDDARRTVLRGNSGLTYDQPINAIYEQAIVQD